MNRKRYAAKTAASAAAAFFCLIDRLFADNSIRYGNAFFCAKALWRLFQDIIVKKGIIARNTNFEIIRSYQAIVCQGELPVKDITGFHIRQRNRGRIHNHYRRRDIGFEGRFEHDLVLIFDGCLNNLPLHRYQVVPEEGLPDVGYTGFDPDSADIFRMFIRCDPALVPAGRQVRKKRFAKFIPEDSKGAAESKEEKAPAEESEEEKAPAEESKETEDSKN